MADIQENVSTGRLDWGGGFTYTGEIRDGEANGYGEIYYEGEKIYEGHLVNNERSGKGVQYAMGILQYEGDFLHDKRHGKGTQWWPLDHSKYVGDFKEGERTGKGILYIDEIKRYEGDFVNGKFHGNGVYYDEYGDVSYQGKFENNGIAYDLAPMNGNKWVSVFSVDGKRIAESYKLTFSLQPHTQDLKDEVELYLRLVDDPTEKVSALGISAHFTSKGKNAFILGGFPAGLRDGKMTVQLKGGERITLNPSDISHDMNVNDGSIDENVVYNLDKDTLQTLCDGEIISINLTGSSRWSQKLVGEEITFLLRAFWNGTYNNSDYVNYLQLSPAAPKFNRTQGCYIATAVYGSYDCPEVWTLRRFRDYTLDENLLGRIFIKIYYATSPTLVKWFGQSNVFKSLLRNGLDRLVTALQRKGYEDTPYNDKY